MKRILIGVGAALLLALGIAFYLNEPRQVFLPERPSHGVSFVLELNSSGPGKDADALAHLREALSKRCDRLGLPVFFAPLAENRVEVAVPDSTPGDRGTWQASLFGQGRLELRLVHEASDQLIGQAGLPSGYELLEQEIAVGGGQKRTEKLVVKQSGEPGLTGQLIKHALVARGPLDEPQINFSLQPEAAVAFGTVTTENIGRRLAIILDGKLYSAPVIRSPITTGNAQINGQFSLPEATALAAAMDCPLPVPIKVVESKSY